MRKKIGFSLSEYTNYQTVADLVTISKIVKQQQNEQIDMTIFTRQQVNPIYIPVCSILSQKEMWAYDGVVVANDLASAQDLILSPRPTKKYFYVTDLEWIYKHNTFQSFADIYLSDELNLIARSDLHANILARMWKAPALVIPKFTYQHILYLLE